MAEDLAFRFRGPAGDQNLCARNLTLFSLLAAGVDDETWLFRLSRNDFSTWFEHVIKDKGLASDARAAEQDTDLDPFESRTRITRAIEDRYTAPA